MSCRRVSRSCIGIAPLAVAPVDAPVCTMITVPPAFAGMRWLHQFKVNCLLLRAMEHGDTGVVEAGLRLVRVVCTKTENNKGVCTAPSPLR